MNCSRKKIIKEYGSGELPSLIKVFHFSYSEDRFLNTKIFKDAEVWETVPFERKLPIRIVRPFNNYGPGLSIGDKRLPADLAHSIINNQDIILYSDGSPTRTYCYIADAIVGYIKSMVHNKFEVFNIGIDKPELTVHNFAKIFIKKGKKIFGYNKKLLFKQSSDSDYLEHNPNRRCPNIIKAKTELTYDPAIDPNEGVERYLTHLKLNGNK